MSKSKVIAVEREITLLIEVDVEVHAGHPGRGEWGYSLGDPAEPPSGEVVAIRYVPPVPKMNPRPKVKPIDLPGTVLDNRDEDEAIEAALQEAAEREADAIDAAADAAYERERDARWET